MGTKILNGNLQVSGNLTDGTNSVSVASIVNGLNKSEIVDLDTFIDNDQTNFWITLGSSLQMEADDFVFQYIFVSGKCLTASMECSGYKGLDLTANTYNNLIRSNIIELTSATYPLVVDETGSGSILLRKQSVVSLTDQATGNAMEVAFFTGLGHHLALFKMIQDNDGTVYEFYELFHVVEDSAGIGLDPFVFTNAEKLSQADLDDALSGIDFEAFFKSKQIKITTGWKKIITQAEFIHYLVMTDDEKWLTKYMWLTTPNLLGYDYLKPGPTILFLPTYVSDSYIAILGPGNGDDPQILLFEMVADDHIAPLFDKTNAYAVGNLVTNGNRLYKCIRATTANSNWSDNDWTEVYAKDVFATTDDIPNNSNIENGTGTNAIREKMVDATINFTGRNPNAEAIDSSLSTTLNTGASGNQSAAFNKNTVALGIASFANGNKTVAKGEESHAEGYQSVTLGDGSHAEGAQTVAAGLQSHSEGALTQALGAQSHAEGHETIAGALASHAEGAGTKIGSYSPASDQGADQSGSGSGGGGGDTPPSPGTFTAGEGSHAEGYSNLIVGFGSHAEGLRNYLNGNYAHIEGVNNTNSGDYSHVEGYNNINSAEVSLVAGRWNNNSGANSILLGHHLTNTQANKVIVGQYNNPSSIAIFAVGTGTSSEGKNGLSVFGDGHVEVANQGSTNKSVVIKEALGTAATCNTGTSSGNVPVLDSNGKLAGSVIPSSITNNLSITGDLSVTGNITSDTLSYTPEVILSDTEIPNSVQIVTFASLSGNTLTLTTKYLRLDFAPEEEE